LYVTDAGAQLQARAQAEVGALEHSEITRLSADERATLIRLLRRIYQDEAA
jgi:DNA-binding MarR family transcriptional regulator